MLTKGKNVVLPLATDFLGKELHFQQEKKYY